VILVVAGILALAYGGFTYIHRTPVAKVGSIELTMHEKRSVNVPIWAGVGAIVLGGILLAVRQKK
jgi:TRAP-type C4-dicarboxylate transport system permease small subunit